MARTMSPLGSPSPAPVANLTKDERIFRCLHGVTRLVLTNLGLGHVIDGNTRFAGILRIRPSKTEGTADAEIAVDLKLCLMVLEEMAHIPEERRHGPMVVHKRHHRQSRGRELTELWTIVRKHAGLPKSLWCRDLRASAITEARDNGASTNDASKVAGHSKPRISAAVYDLSSLEAQRRFAVARAAKRAGNDVGNE